MRRRISIWGCVRPSVGPSVRRSVGPSVRRSVRPYVPCYFRRWKVRILGASCAVYPALFLFFPYSLPFAFPSLLHIFLLLSFFPASSCYSSCFSYTSTFGLSFSDNFSCCLFFLSFTIISVLPLSYPYLLFPPRFPSFSSLSPVIPFGGIRIPSTAILEPILKRKKQSK